MNPKSLITRDYSVPSILNLMKRPPYRARSAQVVRWRTYNRPVIVVVVKADPDVKVPEEFVVDVLIQGHPNTASRCNAWIEPDSSIKSRRIESKR